MSRRKEREGFTLIEVLVALAITSILTLILYTSFSGLHGSAEALTDYSEKYRQTVLFMNLMSNDLTGVFFSSALPFGEFTLTERNMGGDTYSEVSFSCFLDQFLRIDRYSTDIVRVTYRPEIDDEGEVSIYREVNPNLQVPSFDETLTEQVLTGVTSFSLTALTGEESEDGEWDSEGNMKLPDRLRISVTFPGGQRISREYFLPLTGDVGRFGNSGKRSK